MTGRIQREDLRGEVVKLFPSWHTGIIHGDDGYDVTFSEDSLVLGFSYAEVSLGLRVSYGVLFAAGAKVPTAFNLKPGHEKGETDHGRNDLARLSEPTERHDP
jgi:hypothetical protein